MTLLRIIAGLFVTAIALAPMDAAAILQDEDSKSAQAVKTAADEYFAERFPEMASRLSVRVVRVSRSAGEGDVRVRPTILDGIPRGHTQVKLLAESGGQITEVGSAMIFVAHFDSVAVALRDIPSGEEVGATDVASAWVEVTAFRGEPLRSTDFRARLSSEGLVARHGKKAGDALRADDVRAPFAAESGEPVSMTFRRGPIFLQLTCKARESGVTGDVIRLHSADVNAIYKARLTGPGKAEWISTL